MWEFCIKVKKENFEIAKFIYNTLKSETRELGAVITCYEEFDLVCIMIGCERYNEDRVEIIIERTIIKVICTQFKDSYISKYLNLPNQDKIGLMAFKKALLNFDRETDYYLISKNLSFNNNLYLESFFDFRLKEIREKWSELVCLANENRDYLVSHEAFFDLLKFLIDNLEIGESEINVVEDEEGYKILDTSFETLIKEKQYYDNEDLISSLIDLSPKKINLYCKNENNVIKLLEKIFDDRIDIMFPNELKHFDNINVISKNF
ncbi:MAG: hypothetical protein IJ008_02660 [Clostridia bacterium]|nr:hypothetical protein [Clostridia bacterium]